MLENILNNKLASNEDAITSTIIGLLKYLPADLFWHILRQACGNNKLPPISGTLKQTEFWPKWNAAGTSNSKYVEPDVFLRFDSFDLIIEVKSSDEGGQYAQQWENQIKAYTNEYEKQELVYITLGGNAVKINQEIEVDDKKYAITKCSWMSLLMETSATLQEFKKTEAPFSNKASTIRLLEDVIRGFNYHGFFNIKWFEGMKMYTIEL